MTDIKEPKKIVKNSEGYQDPVKLYLRDVGKAPLLTHKQEIEISQTIEQSKQAIIDRLFGIPLTINTVTSWIESALSSAQDAVDRFDIDLSADDMVPAEFTEQLIKVKDLCEQYKQNITDSDIKQQLTTAFNDLPLNPASLTHLMDQVIAYNRQVTSIDGELVRLAESCGIERLEWLSLYMQHDNLAYLYAQEKAPFKNLMSKYGAKIAECNIKITEIESKTGMTVKELRQVVKDLRRHAKVKEEAIQRMVTSNLRLVVSIAKRYNTDVGSLAKSSNISDPNKISVGQNISLSGQ